MSTPAGASLYGPEEAMGWSKDAGSVARKRERLREAVWDPEVKCRRALRQD